MISSLLARRPAGALAAAALAVAALAPLAPPSAAAATPTCHGQAATVVGTPGGGADGTSGHDVIVSNGAASVFTDGGDDLVCITGSTGTQSSVSVGTFDGDTVDASASLSPIFVSVRSGTTLVGSRFNDFIGVSHDSSAPDTISAGAGNDTVVVGTAAGVAPVADHIDAGAGNDNVQLGGQVEGRATLAGGTGKNTLSLYTPTLSPVYVVNFATSRLGTGATASTITGFTELSASGSWHSLSVTGSNRPESVFTGREPTAHQGPVSMHMGGGDDRVTLARHEVGTVDGGSGTNVFTSVQATVNVTDKAATVSLKNGTLRDAGVVTHLEHFTRLQVQDVVKATVTGTSHRDVVIVNACEAKISGLGGNDQLRFSLPPTAGTCKHPPAVRGRIYGGGGNDVLSGSSKKDVLIGGAGSDQIDGHGGHDKCVAERKISCG